MPKNLAIIPARAGSKRLPRKNIMPLDGIPLLSYTVKAATESDLFDRVVVSTEDMEIARVGKIAGAEVLDRPSDLANDSARVRDVCQHVLEMFKDEDGAVYDQFCVLTATSVLRTANDIKQSYEVLCKGFDSVIAVTEYFFYPHAAIILNEHDEARYYWPEIALSKGQEVPKFLVENGSINWCRTREFLRESELMCGKTGVYKMEKYRSIDVDTIEDFIMMESIYYMIKKQEILGI